MDADTPGSDFAAVTRFHPHGPAYWATHPRKFFRALGHAPVAVRVAADGRDWGPDASWWTLDRRRHGDRVAISFATPGAATRWAARWRIIAAAIGDLARRLPDLEFHEFPLDLNDGVHAGQPHFVHAFARPAGTDYGLVPNPYLLRPRPWLLPPLPWDWKTDTLYFRGSSTGSVDYDRNVRVALCRLARSLPRADCKLSRTRHSDPAFVARLQADGVIGRRHPPDALNRHRFLVDADGHVSSWDRFLLIGTFGGVPIRFENAWEECWHGRLIDGVNCVLADRQSLPDRLAGLRGDEDRGRRIAAAARRLVFEHLSRPALLETLAAALVRHETGP
jgi:hypothetical protein